MIAGAARAERIERLHVLPFPVILHDERERTAALADEHTLIQEPAAREPIDDVPDARVEVLVPLDEDLAVGAVPVEVRTAHAVGPELGARDERVASRGPDGRFTAEFHDATLRLTFRVSSSSMDTAGRAVRVGLQGVADAGLPGAQVGLGLGELGGRGGALEVRLFARIAIEVEYARLAAYEAVDVLAIARAHREQRQRGVS